MYRAATQNRPCMRSLIVDFRISKLFSFCMKWVISETSQIDSMCIAESSSWSVGPVKIPVIGFQKCLILKIWRRSFEEH